MMSLITEYFVSCLSCLIMIHEEQMDNEGQRQTMESIEAWQDSVAEQTEALQKYLLDWRSLLLQIISSALMTDTDIGETISSQ